MRLNINRENEISSLAEAVLEDYAAEMPFEPEIIAQNVGITYSFNNYGDAFDGILEHRNNKFHIFCNLREKYTQTSPRVRFTFSHELGHYFIDEHRNSLIKNNIRHTSISEFVSENKIEMEADWFASNLLMPNRIIHKMIRQYKNQSGFEIISQLASKFQVSLTSAAIRYISIDPSPAAIIMWGPDQRRKWFYYSRSFLTKNFGFPLQDLNTLNKDSATFQAAYSKTSETLNKIFRSATTLALWFTNVSSTNSYRDKIYFEEAIKLGQFGTLTILFPDNP